MTDAQAQDLMRRFARAFFNRSESELADVTTDDVEWHFAIGEDAPDGRVHRGVAGILAGIEMNATIFEALRFEDVHLRLVSSTEILMTCRVDGRRRDGGPFSVRSIELITVRDGRVAKKDVFWKQTGAG